MAHVIAFIIYFLVGSLLGSAIAFLIFSCVLNSSNNFGTKRKRDVQPQFTHNCVFTSRVDKMKNNQRDFDEYVTINMQNIIRSQNYQSAMASAIKKNDTAEVTHES